MNRHNEVTYELRFFLSQESLPRQRPKQPQSDVDLSGRWHVTLVRDSNRMKNRGWSGVDDQCDCDCDC